MTDWYGCYSDSWKGNITDEAFSHPAKFAYGLIKRIYKHAFEKGYIFEGDRILDCFGGVGLGAFFASLNGLAWVGNELEPRFVELGYQNFALWAEKKWCMCQDKEYLELLREFSTPESKDTPQLSFFEPAKKDKAELLKQLWQYQQVPRENVGTICPDCGKVIVVLPVLLQGDSRFLSVGLVQGLVGSPPYATDQFGGGGNKHVIDAMKSGYGTTPNQLGNLPSGDFESLISSPPFTDSTGSDNPDKRGGLYHDEKRRNDKNLTGEYGQAEGQLGNLPGGNLDSLIGSPPYANSLESDSGIDTSKIASQAGKNSQGLQPTTRYGDEQGQLGALKEGNLDSLISSPSFAGNTGGRGEASRQGIDAALFDRHSGGMKKGTGETKGNIDHLPMSGLDEVMDGLVGSPPYDIDHAPGNKNWTGQISGNIAQSGYGSTPGQIGTESGLTFWQANKDILLECHRVLKPNAYLFWVVKPYVKSKKIVDFPGQWRKLNEACGFEYVEEIRAWQTDSQTRMDLFDVEQTKRTDRKSFFRILHENKQRAAKHWETLTRSKQAAALWAGHHEAWKGKKQPSRQRILEIGQMIKWKEDGKPDYKIETGIDYEVVLIMRKK